MLLYVSTVVAKCKEYVMSYRGEEEVTFGEYLSEGLKLLAIILVFGVVFLMIAAYGCNHDACHVPETWIPILTFFNLIGT